MFFNWIFRTVISRVITFNRLYSRQVMFVPLYSRIYFHKPHILWKEINLLSTRPVNLNQHSNTEEPVNSSVMPSEMVHRLETDIILFNKVKLEDLETLLKIFKQSGEPPPNKYDLLAFEWCTLYLPDISPAFRVTFVHSVWETLKSLGTVFVTDHFNALLKCYSASNHKISVEKFLNDMGNVKPDKRTYELLLHCTCVNGDIEEATSVIHLMKENNIPVSEVTFNSLILCHARAGNIESSLFILDTMRAAMVEPSVNTYTALFQSFSEFGDIERIKTVYEKEVSHQFTFSDSQVMSICVSLATSGHHSFIPEFLELLPEDNKNFTSTVKNTILSLVHMKKEEAALTILLCIQPVLGKDPKEHKCAFFVQELCKAEAELSCIIKLCNILEENGVFQRALLEAAHSYLTLLKPDLTIQIFYALAKNGASLRPHYFWPLFRQRTMLYGETGVLTTLKEMQNLKVTPDFQTLLDYVLPIISSTTPETTIQKLKKYNIPVSESITPVAAFLVDSRKMKPLVHLCQQYTNQIQFSKLLPLLVEMFITKRNVAFIINILQYAQKSTTDDLAGQFILELLTVKQSRIRNEDIMQLLAGFQNAEIYISSFTSEILIQHLKNGSKESQVSEKDQLFLESITKSHLRISPTELFADHIVHPRDMNLEDLECHLVELKAKNMNTRGVLRRLLQLNCQIGNATRVMEIRKELEDFEFKLSPGMLSNLFAMYIHLQDIDNAEKCLSEITNVDPNFTVDEFKIIDYATLLVNKGQYKAAVAALERRAGAGNISGGKAVSRNCWQLLDALARRGEPDHTKHMLHLLVTLGFCSVSNILLGPLVRAYLEKGDCQGAVKEFVRSCREYKKTPLLQELLNHLVLKNEDSPYVSQLIGEVLISSSMVHRESSTNVFYAIALANGGKKNQLLNFIKKKGEHLQYSMIVKQCNKLASQNKFTELLVLTEALQNLPGFDIIVLYDLMLQLCDKEADCDAAIQLWTDMQERNVMPSKIFLTNLASLLKRHNIKLPFVEPDK